MLRMVMVVVVVGGDFDRYKNESLFVCWWREPTWANEKADNTHTHTTKR
jgi:hypothetical protein